MKKLVSAVASLIVGGIASNEVSGHLTLWSLVIWFLVSFVSFYIIKKIVE